MGTLGDIAQYVDRGYELLAILVNNEEQGIATPPDIVAEIQELSKLTYPIQEVLAETRQASIVPLPVHKSAPPRPVSATQMDVHLSTIEEIAYALGRADARAALEVLLNDVDEFGDSEYGTLLRKANVRPGVSTAVRHGHMRPFRIENVSKGSKFESAVTEYRRGLAELLSQEYVFANLPRTRERIHSSSFVVSESGDARAVASFLRKARRADEDPDVLHAHSLGDKGKRDLKAYAVAKATIAEARRIVDEMSAMMLYDEISRITTADLEVPVEVALQNARESLCERAQAEPDTREVCMRAALLPVSLSALERAIRKDRAVAQMTTRRPRPSPVAR